MLFSFVVLFFKMGGVVLVNEFDMKGIGKNIRILRQNRKMTQKQLAEATGLATITIQQYERGIREPRFDNLTRIAKALNVSPVVFTITGLEVLSDKEAEKLKNHVPSKEAQLLNEQLQKKNQEDLELFGHIIGTNNVLLLLDAVSIMNSDGIDEAVKRFLEVAEIPKYQHEDCESSETIEISPLLPDQK